MTASRHPSSESAEIGSDKVLFHGESVIIYAAREMSDWQVREFCRIPIFFRGRKYYLMRKSRMAAPYAMGYELAPWPDEFQGESKLSITYGEEYVAERDRFAGDDRRNEFHRLVLLAFYPLLGFLWSGFKDRRLERFGFIPRSITEASLVVLLAFVLCESVFLLILQCGFLQTVYGLSEMGFDWLLFGAGTLDLVIRSDQLLRGAEHPDGFLEWLARLIVKLMTRLKPKG